MEEDADESETEALSRSVVTQFEQYIKLNRKVPPEVLGVDQPDRGAE